MNTKQRIASFLIALTLVVGVGIPERAHAQAAVVFDPTNLVQNLRSAVQETWLVLKEQSLDAIAWKVGREAIKSISHSTIKWINSGFNGSPAYVTDLQQNLLSLSDKIANDFFKDLTSDKSVTSPFRNIIAASLRDQYYQATGRNSYFNLNQYTLNQFSQNPEAFLGGDFSQGGLNAWFNAWKNPNNNPFGARRTAEAELARRVNSAQTTRLTELQWGSGMQSFRGNCAAAATHEGTHSTETTGQSQGGSVSLSSVDNCAGKPILTPGAQINASLEKVTGIELDELNIADEFNEVLGALMTQLMKQMLGGGGLFGVSQPSSGGGSSFIDQLNNSSAGGGSGNTVASFTQMIAEQKQAMAEYTANWMTIKGEAQHAIEACSNDGNAPSVVSQADAAIAKADATVKMLIEMEVQMTEANQASGAAQTAAINAVMESYDQLLQTAPTATEIVYAQTQSQDASGTLFNQMKVLKEMCGG